MLLNTLDICLNNLQRAPLVCPVGQKARTIYTLLLHSRIMEFLTEDTSRVILSRVFKPQETFSLLCVWIYSLCNSLNMPRV